MFRLQHSPASASGVLARKWWNQPTFPQGSLDGRATVPASSSQEELPALDPHMCANPTPEAGHQLRLSIEKSHSCFYGQREEKQSFQRQELRAEGQLRLASYSKTALLLYFFPKWSSFALVSDTFY